jgi:hypothetical protein
MPSYVFTFLEDLEQKWVDIIANATKFTNLLKYEQFIQFSVFIYNLHGRPTSGKIVVDAF